MKPVQVFVAQRSFVKNDKLNLIIGDYNKPRDIGYEAANAYINKEKKRKKTELAKKRKELRETLDCEDPRYRNEPGQREEIR